MGWRKKFKIKPIINQGFIMNFSLCEIINKKN